MLAFVVLLVLHIKKVIQLKAVRYGNLSFQLNTTTQTEDTEHSVDTSDHSGIEVNLDALDQITQIDQTAASPVASRTRSKYNLN